MESKPLSHLKINFPFINKVFPFTKESEFSEILNGLANRDSKLINGQRHETTFYDLLNFDVDSEIGTARERELSHKFLSLLNDSVKIFFELVNGDPTLIEQLKSQLNNLFRVNGYKYMDKIGELLSTNYLIKKYHDHKLIALEFEFEKPIRPKNSKDTDLLFRQNGTNNRCLIEIFNLNLDYEKIESEEGLAKLLNYRLGKKSREKHLDTDFVKKNFHQAVLQPFIWIFDINTINKYAEFWKRFRPKNTLPILCLRQRSDSNHKLYFDCVEVTKINS